MRKNRIPTSRAVYFNNCSDIIDNKEYYIGLYLMHDRSIYVTNLTTERHYERLEMRDQRGTMLRLHEVRRRRFIYKCKVLS